MSVSTIEGFVENGQIRLPASVHLPERAKVYVVIPDVMDISIPNRVLHFRSPHLVHPEQAADFRLEMVEENPK